MATVYFSLGSNLGDRKENLEKAIKMIRKNMGKLTAISSIYETEPWGFMHENYFYNLVISVESSLNPAELFGELSRIENYFGRTRNKLSYEARILDIDILFYDNQIINTKELIIPHPRIQERLFVLVPLAELAPDFIHPELLKTVNQLLASCPDNKKIEKVS